MSNLKSIHVVVNDQPQTCSVEPRTHVIDMIREQLGLKGTHLGCEHGVCGACSIEVDGRLVRGCLTLAVQTDGKSIRTVEGLSKFPEAQQLQKAFIKHNALQCGFCTPGMLMAAKELLQHKPDATRQEVRDWMSGNYCRCTGYHAIVDAVCEVLEQRRQEVNA
jgi:aerobic-type carbon monoxide dehydrogenase small subunit (CoxS/CutS family)